MTDLERLQLAPRNELVDLGRAAVEQCLHVGDIVQVCGQSARVFKGEMKAMKDDDKASGVAQSTDAADASAPDATTPAAPSATDGTADQKP